MDSLDDLRLRYESEAPRPTPDQRRRFTTEGYGYIHWKAFVFQAVGPAEYRRSDALHMPPEDWAGPRVDRLTGGCRQLFNYRGLAVSEPLEGLGVSGFYDLLRLFHFQMVNQVALPAESDDIIDQMLMRHVAYGESYDVVLFNRVTLPTGPREPGPSCPSCGQPLRTAHAKQCRHCGKDWHLPRAAA